MKVLVFPQENNPYQYLLYSAMTENVTVTYLNINVKGKLRSITFFIRLLMTLIIMRIRGYSVLHIHWLYTLGLPEYVPFAKHIAFYCSILFIGFSCLIGYKIIWTAHNVLPHSAVTANDRAVRRYLIKKSFRVIIHSVSTLDEFAKIDISLPSYNVIPHGNYISVYPNKITKVQARKKLGITLDPFIFLFIGSVHRYKNVPALIDDFKELSKEYPDNILVIAGKCNDSQLATAINKQIADFESIKFYNERIDDNAIQYYLKSADVATFPFSEVTTSGSVILAASFGVPLIAPRLGAIKDIPNQTGYFYTPSQSGLKTAMKKSIADRKNYSQKSAAVYAYAEDLSWKVIADKTEKIYAESINAKTK